MATAEFTSLQPSLDGWSLLIFLGTVQGFFLAVNCLLTPKGNRLSRHLLGWLLMSVSLLVAEVLLCHSNYIAYVPFLVSFSEPLNFCFPPLLFLYTLSLIRPDFRWKASYWWLFLPTLGHAIYLIPFFSQSNSWLLETVAVAYHKNYHPVAPFRHLWWADSYGWFYPTFKLLIISYQVFYLLLTLQLIHRYKRQKSVLPSASLQWIRQLCFSFVGVLLAYAFLTWYYQSDVGDVYVAVCTSLVFYGMSIRMTTQSRILEYQPKNEAVANPAPVKYEKTALDAATSAHTLQRLLAHMETDKPYLNADLSLPELAAQLTIAPHHLSQVINQYCQRNFFDFINTYRIREVQQKLLASEYGHLKIEEIAFESGFNSKSAFNAAFKKLTQLTPSQYRKASQPS